jgi:hypothetical protein
MKPFEGVFGRLAPDPKLAEANLRRIVRRVQRMAEQGTPPTGIYRDIAELEDRSGAYYGPDYKTPHHDEDQQPEPEPAPPYYAIEADRQRANLRQFQDVRELVRGWRSGNISWDTARWGPDPDDIGCLIPWDVLQEARS